jgi:hypothetical protein
MVRQLVSIATSAALVLAPIAAQAAPARETAPVPGQSEELLPGVSGVGAVFGLLVFGLIILLLVDSDDEGPESP